MTSTRANPLTQIKTLWKSLSRQDQFTLIATSIAGISPFLPWFHSCLRRPGVYACTTWNGWQFDNDIFGSLIFVIAAAILLTLFWPETRPFEFPLTQKQIRRSGAPLLLGLALIRLLTFQGESNESTTIGINIGLLLLLFASLVLLIMTEQEIFARLHRLLAKGISGGVASGPLGPKTELHQHELDDIDLETAPNPPKQQPLI